MTCSTELSGDSRLWTRAFSAGYLEDHIRTPSVNSHGPRSSVKESACVRAQPASAGPSPIPDSLSPIPDCCCCGLSQRRELRRGDEDDSDKLEDPTHENQCGWFAQYVQNGFSTAASLISQ